jgi:hypothetical protein
MSQLTVPKVGRVRAATTNQAPKKAEYAHATPKGLQFPEEDEEGRESITGLRKYDALEDLLTSRPEKNELINRNILKAGDVSSLISATQDQLKRKMIEDTLKDKIDRPGRDELVQKNILKGFCSNSGDNEVSATLIATQEQLKRKMIEDNLNSRISARPDANNLQSILKK